MNMEFERKLALPSEIKEMFPISDETNKRIKERREEIKAVFEGKSDKLILIIGPCSADFEDSVIDYISRLAPLQDKVKDRILIIPRIYTNKPRTTGEGYKGMLHQPDPTGKSDLFKGLIATRHMHHRAIGETGFICADEMLYPENYQYLDDLLAYVAVGARSVEDQQHRLTASGIDVPVGMKNPTSGDYSVMMNAILAAQHGSAIGTVAHQTGLPPDDAADIIARMFIADETVVGAADHRSSGKSRYPTGIRSAPATKFRDLRRICGQLAQQIRIHLVFLGDPLRTVI